VICTITDSVGYNTVCNFDVTVTDDEAPSIACVSNPQDKNTDTGVCNYTVQGTEFDPTSLATTVRRIDHQRFQRRQHAGRRRLPKGTNTVIWTVTDAVATRRRAALTWW